MSLASASATTRYTPFTSTSAKPDVRKAVEKASIALALVRGLLLIRLMVPLTLGSTKMVWPVAFANTLATDSISAFEKDRVTAPSSGTVILDCGAFTLV